jgi:tetratricopeptide (TPR) repeat protein
MALGARDGVSSHVRRSALAIGMALLAILTFGGRARAASPAAEASALCATADRVPERERRALLEHGLAVAEAAVAADDHDAAAHLALFCNLGKRMRLDGVSLASLVALRRLRHEIDRTLELAPTDADALVGKAALLYYTPRLLGGDPAEGERLLRTALAVAPDYLDARLALARILRDRGDRDGARENATRALADASATGHVVQEAEALRLLHQLSD